MDRAVGIAVRVAQGILKVEEPNIVMDGVWGNLTQQAWRRSSLQGAILAAVKAIAPKVDVPNLGKARMIGSMSAEVERAITYAAEQFGEPLAAMVSKAEIESNFNPRAENGSYAGLYQMSREAWSDARDEAARRGIRIPAYEAGKFNPKWNALAGAAYRGVLRRQLTSHGYTGEIDDAVLYLAHQQGAAGFAKLYSVASGDDELVGSEVVTYARRMANNPPQDGRGVTTDPYEFVTRWLEVAYAKTSA